MHAVPVEELYGVDEPEPGLAVHVDRAARYAPAALQARALGQDDRDGSVDEPGRPGHDLPPARHSAAGTAGANLPHRHRHHDALQGRGRRRRWVRGAPHDCARREAARSPARRRSTPTWGTRSASGKATRSSSTRSGSPTRPGSRAAATSTPTRCASSRSSRGPGTRLLYEVTVEDPEVLVEPWVMPTRRLRLGQQHDHRRARKLHGERAQGSQHPDAALRLDRTT